MAVTITRTARIDDDGTGTTGTVINNAEKTSLYNEIDTALAKVAQLAGGNAFTGTQTITGGMSVVTSGITRLAVLGTGEVCLNTAGPGAVGNFPLCIAGAGPGQVPVGIKNTDAGNSMYCLAIYNSTGGTAGSIHQTGVTTVAYETTSDARLKTDRGRAVDLAALRAIVVHDFTWTADGVRDRGVFAQEAHAVFPRAVSTGTDETTDDGVTLARPWMTDYSKFVPDLIVGWQQHDAELTALRALLAAVKG